jgi:hypothetical protein
VRAACGNTAPIEKMRNPLGRNLFCRSAAFRTKGNTFQVLHLRARLAETAK